MKILLIADVHNRPLVSARSRKKTLTGLKKVITKTPCDLIVFLGDIVHGPDFKQVNEDYGYYLRQVLDITGDIPFATVFGNHDDECDISKNEILEIIKSYPNSLTKGENYVLNMKGETLLFIDSGSYYDGEASLYDTVEQPVIDWAVKEIKGRKAILFQHIIVPDIFNVIDEYEHFRLFCVYSSGKWIRFKKRTQKTGDLFERPCPPDVSTAELEQLAPYLKGAVFGHDHFNTFELDLMGVRLVQCGGCGTNCYDKYFPSSVKLLDTETMKTKKINIF